MNLDQQTVEQIAAIAEDEGLELLAAEMVGVGPRRCFVWSSTAPTG